MENNINKRFLAVAWFITGLFVLTCITAVAQSNPIAELKPIFEKLKSYKTYSYENHTSIVFPNGQKDQATIQVFMDKPHKRLCYKSKHEAVMLNQEWLYKADHVNQTAGVFNITRYDKKYKGSLPGIESVFKYDMAAMFVDSLLYRYGKILSKTQKGAVVTYTIGFNGIAVKEMVLAYNTATGVPETITLRTEAKADAKGRKMITETVCRNYALSVPESIFDEHTYFSIVKGKPLLVQHKNYKVYSVL